MNTLITIIVSKISGSDTNNYKQRFVNEYAELKDKYNKVTLYNAIY